MRLAALAAILAVANASTPFAATSMGNGEPGDSGSCCGMAGGRSGGSMSATDRQRAIVSDAVRRSGSDSFSGCSSCRAGIGGGLNGGSNENRR